MYPVVNFLAQHPAIIVAIGAIIAVAGSLLPYAERQMRPSEYIYLAWVDGLKGTSPLLDYQRFEWPHGETTMVLPVPEPKQLEVRGNDQAKLMLLVPKSWGVEMWMGIEGMEPAARHSPNEDLPATVGIKDLGMSGEKISMNYLTSPKPKGLNYSIQGIEWWSTASWNDGRRVQITRPSP